jgi:hypothetical protein
MELSGRPKFPTCSLVWPKSPSGQKIEDSESINLPELHDAFAAYHLGYSSVNFTFLWEV